MPAGYSFRPRAWAFAAAAAACAAGIALGHWQAGRADEKRVLGARLEQAFKAPPLEIPDGKIDPRDYVMRHVAARGRFADEHTVYLDNKLRHGRPGYEVVTPLRLDGVYVLVNRGWVEAGRTRAVLPRVPAPAGEVRVEGLGLARLPHALELGEAAPGKVRQNVDLPALEKETGLRFQPIVIEQHSSAPDGLTRDWPRPDAGIEKHESYALQWYSLAALAVVLFVALSFRRAGAP
ncbi:MAG TPA: SURF1 family protein [Burkholderiales bacterium]|jgi:surfeit locus 1 family protein|nr:SURF1 family protein [Burkholderiales bacterium]